MLYHVNAFRRAVYKLPHDTEVTITYSVRVLTYISLRVMFFSLQLILQSIRLLFHESMWSKEPLSVEYTYVLTHSALIVFDHYCGRF